MRYNVITIIFEPCLGGRLRVYSRLKELNPEAFQEHFFRVMQTINAYRDKQLARVKEDIEAGAGADPLVQDQVEGGAANRAAEQDQIKQINDILDQSCPGGQCEVKF